MVSHNKSPTTRTIVRGQCGFTLVELLVVIAIISVIAGFLIPTLLKSRAEADKVACANNLRELAKMGMLYADGGNRFFPHTRGGKTAHEHLNSLVEFFAAGTSRLKPAIFICRSWRGEPAELDEDGKFLLDEESCAYTWPNQRLAPTDAAPLSSDKFTKSEDQLSGHELGMNVVYTDSSIEWMQAKDLNEDGLPKGLSR